MSAHERIGVLGEEDLRYFKPRVFPNERVGARVATIRQQFYCKLTEMFSLHPGGLVLAVHENDVTGYEKRRMIRTDIYLGIINDKVENILTASGNVLFPTSRYVISQACEMAFQRKEGALEETVFGKNTNTIWLYNELLLDGCYALDFFFGTTEVDKWLSRWNGSRPYLREGIMARLYAGTFSENLTLQLI